MKKHVEQPQSKYLLESRDRMTGTGRGPMGTQESNPFSTERFNAPATIGASALLWAFSIACFLAPANMVDLMSQGKSGATWISSWLYIGSNGVWCFFIIAVYVKYGHVKMGKGDDKPEFGDASYFMMIFCAGVGIGHIFCGASEPTWHYLGGLWSGSEGWNANRRADAGYLNDNGRALHAINITLYHWGVHAWVSYAITAVMLGQI